MTPILRTLAIIASGPFALNITAPAASVTFDSYATGNLPGGSEWNEKWVAAPSSQQFLYQVGAANGVGGSQGIAVSTSLVESGYSAKYQAGVSGTSYTVSAQFQMTIDDTAPDKPNHSAFGVLLSDAPQAWNGGATHNVEFTLVRRDGGNRYGATGLTLAGVPQGWEQNSELGLPNTLPAAATTATSDWFSIRLTITDTGSGTWDLLGEVIDSGDNVVYSYLDANKALPAGFTPGATLYGGLVVPWVDSASYLVLSQGHVDSLNIDNFSITAIPEPGSIALLSLSSLALLRRRRA
jgi:hypothetical protein